MPRVSQVVCEQEKSNFSKKCNSIECQHYLEKKEQSSRKGTVEDVIKTFKSLVERQQDEEVRAIYRSGPYRLSDRYKKFEVYSVKWHSIDPEA